MLFILYYNAFFFIIDVLIVYSLLNAGSLNMGKGKADGTGFLSKLTTMTSRSGRPRTLSPDYLRMTPHREVEGEVPLEEDRVGARNSAPSPT